MKLSRSLRWFQFSLGSLLGLTTVIVVMLAAWRSEVEPYRRQMAIAEAISKAGGSWAAAEGDPWQLWLLGEDSVNVVSIDVSEVDDPEAYLSGILELPRLETLTVGGESFGDDHLARLAKLAPLRSIVLDTTEVSEEALAAFRHRRPDVEVLVSHRRAIAALEAAGWYIQPPIAFSHGLGPGAEEALRYLKRVPGLKRLSLFGPRITDATLVHVRVLQDLEVLALNGTQVTEAGLAQLRNLPRLASLDLHGIKFGDVGLERVLSIRSLKAVQVHDRPKADQDARFSLESYSPWAGPADDAQLELLVLVGTDVTDAGLAAVSELPNLKCFAARGLPLGDAGLCQLVANRNLRSVYVCGTTDFWPSWEARDIVAKLVTFSDRDAVGDERGGLKRLFLHETRITEEGLACLAELSSLERLSLLGNNVGDAGMAHLRQLRALTSLNLNRTRLSDRGLSEVARISTLENLHLENTQVTDEGLQAIKALSRLRRLSLGGSKTTPPGVERFRSGMRSCSVSERPRKLREIDLVRRWWE
jgi:Leucine-rich repeat (LRR) protein